MASEREPGGPVLAMASLSWPWEPLEPRDEESYDPWLLQDMPPSERAYYEANRDIEPQMEGWRAE